MGGMEKPQKDPSPRTDTYAIAGAYTEQNKK